MSDDIVTFKNEYISQGKSGITIYRRLSTGNASAPIGMPFLFADYDVEVTFTPKPKPFVPGYYQYTGGTAEHGRIKWFDYDPFILNQGKTWQLVSVTAA